MSETVETLAILQHYGIRAQKKYGQNFLTDEGVLRGIVAAAEITKEDTVLEIGPGLGTLTRYLAEAAGRVIAVEIDDRLIPVLSDRLKNDENLTLIHGDIMETDLPTLLSEFTGEDQRRIRVVANLPYYITTPILLKLFETPELFQSITVMVQKEVAERLQAAPGTKDYGAITLAVQYYTKPKIKIEVPREAFIPPPGVDSAVIHLEFHNEPPVITEDPKKMFRIVRAAFNQRRKTLANGLKNAQELHATKNGVEAAIESIGKPLTVRGETLTLEEFARLSDALL